MGWDAYANVEKVDGLMKLKNPLHDKIFENAFNNVKRYCGYEFPEWIRVGNLEGSTAERMLSQAVNHIRGYTYAENEWSAEKVRQLNKKAEWWRCEYDKESEFAFYCAKYFLRACALVGVSIKFSY
jgi:hypothetical protein